LADVAENEPTKPSKPGSIGFEGFSPGEFSIIETARILADEAGNEPTKPTKPLAVFLEGGFVGFEGPLLLNAQISRQCES
jgi:hypothetical protein